uniref:Retrovirus-related Pol polyprotein from transposon RE2 n=1 Tax=Vitis vinifera TaxID=29760 RepID=A5AXM1_VITVI|nr:hypothetical protein VITISV_029162 [Vitis vinifera]
MSLRKRPSFVKSFRNSFDSFAKIFAAAKPSLAHECHFAEQEPPFRSYELAAKLQSVKIPVFAVKAPFRKVFRSCETKFGTRVPFHSTVASISKLRSGLRERLFAAKSAAKFLSSPNQKPLMKPGKYWPTPMLAHLVAISSNSKTILKTSPKYLKALMKIQSIIDAVNGRDSTISFDELHEKFINKELSLRNKISPSPLPASAHATNAHSTPWSVTNRTPRLPGSTSTPTQGIIRNSPTNTRDNRPPARLFLGRCQCFRRCNHLLVPAIHHNFDHQLPGKLKQMLQPPSPPTPHGYLIVEPHIIVEVTSHTNGLFLSQSKYIADLLNITHMTEAKPAPTPLATTSSNLSLTRPDIAYTVNKLCQFMHQPTSDHWNAVKRLLRYLCGTLDHSITLRRTSPLAFHAFSDSDWAGNKDDFTSTSAYIIYLGHNPISWSSKKQRTVARSSTEVEYRSVASTAAEIRWICSLLTELGVTLPQQPVIYCDNVGATHLCSNPVFHSRMKHVALDYHFIREQVQNGLLRVSHISASDQLADALTKPLARPQFNSLKAKIGLAPRPSILRGHDKDIQSS